MWRRLNGARAISKITSDKKEFLLMQGGRVDGKKQSTKSSVDVSAPIELNQETTLARLMEHNRFSLLACWIHSKGTPPECVVKFGSIPYVVAISPKQGEVHRAMKTTIYPAK